MNWGKSLLVKGGAIAGLVAVFASIGTIGPALNWNNPSWQKLGVEPKELRSNIESFPSKHCPAEFTGICTTISQGVLKFLGL